MRILFVSSSSGSRGGGEFYLLYLGEALVSAGHEVMFWLSQHTRMDELSVRLGHFGKVVRSEYTNTYDRPLRSLSPIFSDAKTRRIVTEWESLDPDIIHINKQNLEDGLDLLNAARHSDIPSVCMIHITQPAQYLGARFASLRDRQARKFLRRFPGMFVTTPESRARELSEIIGERERIRVIHNGVPSFNSKDMIHFRSKIRSQYGIRDEDILLTAVGRMVHQKRPLHFLDVARKIYQKVPNTRFLWVGDGDLAQVWDEEVMRQDLGGIVQRVGWQQDVHPFLAASDAFLHVARFEGQPHALLEAMSAGLPCIISADLASSLDGFPDDVMLPFRCIEEVVEFLSDRERMKGVAINGKFFFEENLSLSRMADQYISLYAEVISNSKQRAPKEAI